jgi:hypothetical protein
MSHEFIPIEFIGGAVTGMAILFPVPSVHISSAAKQRYSDFQNNIPIVISDSLSYFIK